MNGMDLRTGPTASLGLLHILEDAKGLLEGNALPTDRRNYVLGEAINLLKDAEKGAEFVDSDDFLVEPKKWRAMESYALLSSYLRRSSNAHNENAIREVVTALQQAEKNENIRDNNRVESIATLRALCEQMSRELAARIGRLQDNIPAFR